MNTTQLKAHVKEQIMEFVGRPNDEQTRRELFEVINKLMKKYPMQTHIIAQAVAEGPPDGNQTNS